MKTQYTEIGRLIKRRKGATAADLIAATMSTSIHRRLFEMRTLGGWTIWKERVPGKTYHRYFGKPQGA